MSEINELFAKCDGWHAKEWFERLVKAVDSRNEAVRSGDEIAFATHNNIASSSASRLAMEFRDEIRAALSSAAVAEREPVANKPVSDHWPEAHEVADILSENKGFWRSCSGCHETNEGHPTGPWSMILGCNLGNGCHECGGIGAVWDTTDYADMGDYLAKNIEREPCGWICEGCYRFSADPEDDLKRLRLGGYPSCCPERKISPLYLDPPPTSELEAENARLREELLESNARAERQWGGWVKEETSRKAAEARLAEAMKAFAAIIDRSNNDPLGTSKVNDMRRIAEVAARRVREGGKVDG